MYQVRGQSGSRNSQMFIMFRETKQMEEECSKEACTERERISFKAMGKQNGHAQ
jgi:hypothetical protein